MDDDLARLDAFLKPLLQDLDGASRTSEVERVAAIARRIAPESAATRSFELLVRFRLLAHWLGRVGNLSRAALTTGLSDAELSRTAASVQALDDPQSSEERAVAAAAMIDAAGVRGLAERFGRGRREGHSVLEVASEAMTENEVPQWMNDAASALLAKRRAARDAFCREILEEARGED